MNHIEILQDVLNDFNNDDVLSYFICNHISFCTINRSLMSDKPRKYHNDIKMAELAIKLIQSNRPSETLFPEIYNGYAYDKSCEDDSFWFTPSCEPGYLRSKIREQKIKYLELLIAKLQSELDNNNI